MTIAKINISRSVEICCAKAGINQSKLADIMDVDGTFISRVKKTNNCTSMTLEKIAFALGMTASEFIAEGEEL